MTAPQNSSVWAKLLAPSSPVVVCSAKVTLTAKRKLQKSLFATTTNVSPVALEQLVAVTPQTHLPAKKAHRPASPTGPGEHAKTLLSASRQRIVIEEPVFLTAPNQHPAKSRAKSAQAPLMTSPVATKSAPKMPTVVLNSATKKTAKRITFVKKEAVFPSPAPAPNASWERVSVLTTLRCKPVSKMHRAV